LLSRRKARISFQGCFRNHRPGALKVTGGATGVDDLQPRIRLVGLVPMPHLTPHTEKAKLDGADGPLPGLVPNPLWPSIPYGDPFMIYPGLGGEPLDCIRWEVFAESLQDYAILQTAGVQPDDPLLSALKSYADFPKSETWIHETMAKILRARTGTEAEDQTPRAGVR
jgi:hypothetical protein